MRSASLFAVLLALHLGVAHGRMAPPSQAAAGTAAVMPDEGAPHCHHDAPPNALAPDSPHGGSCCDPGQCHCPVFMAAQPLSAARLLVFVRRSTAPVVFTAAPSRRLAPDLRPPIAA